MKEANQKAIKKAFKKIKEKGLDKRMVEDVGHGNAMLERTNHINKLKKDVQSLSQNTLDEIKCYQRPPTSVHKVMMATLLILGHIEEETEVRSYFCSG